MINDITRFGYIFHCLSLELQDYISTEAKLRILGRSIVLEHYIKVVFVVDRVWLKLLLTTKLSS